MLAVDEGCEGEEGLFDGLASDRAGLDIINPLFCAPAMDLVIGDHMLEIFFIAKEQVISIWRTLESQLVPYILHIFPALPVREIEHQHHSLT